MTISIQDIADQITSGDNVQDASHLTIVGGTIRLTDDDFATAVGAVLDNWNQAAWQDEQDRPFRIFEYVDAIEFTRKPRDTSRDSMFSRGRQFNGRGDLQIRCDSDRLLWSFIGPTGITPPPGLSAINFWDVHPDSQLLARKSHALLWGEFFEQEGRIRDDRVGWADLNYPTEHLGSSQERDRFQLSYTSFAEAGVEAFVWWENVERVEL